MYVTSKIILTVRWLRSTACTSCAAGPRPAGGKQTSWGVRPRALGPTRNSRTACRSSPCSRHSWKKRENVEKRAAFSRHATSWNSLWDTSVKRSSNSHKQRRLLCILSQHCSWKPIAHLSPPPPITVISPICPSQWQVSWSCSLYSFSHKSPLIVSLRACCASPALGLWQGADLLLVFSPLQSAWAGGRGLKKTPRASEKQPQQRTATLQLSITDFSYPLCSWWTHAS